MQDQHLFEYAVIRIIPRVEREEFFNAGIILFCKKLDFLHVLYELNAEKLSLFLHECDAAEIALHLKSFAAIAAANPTAGPISRLPAAERFRWLTAQRSTILQTSKVHPGLCTDPMKKTEELFAKLVL